MVINRKATSSTSPGTEQRTGSTAISPLTRFRRLAKSGVRLVLRILECIVGRNLVTWGHEPHRYGISVFLIVGSRPATNMAVRRNPVVNSAATSMEVNYAASGCERRAVVPRSRRCSTVRPERVECVDPDIEAFVFPVRDLAAEELAREQDGPPEVPQPIR